MLFICVGNAGRSQMAEAFFNHLARGKVQATSAGTNPASRVDPTVIELMNELGIDMSSHYPKKLTVEMLDTADKIITMGCGVAQACPATLAETEDWSIEDPKGQPKEKIRDIRDQIKARVEKLLQEMGI
ncbi:MAG: arsenate reductase ArsC [Chloroflexi bacterium]|nr:arsenate reductase ArsC [Chloroflexota bacterium]MBM3183656.1 arsenate reductase ArsC [Chloroflexota bacterium]